jgi:hypothetical protein
MPRPKGLWYRCASRRRLRPKANEETQLKQLAKYRRNNPALEFYSVEQAPNARVPASQGSRARGQSLNPTQSKVQRAAGAPPGRLSCFGRARNKRRTAGKHLFKEPSPLRPSSLRRWHSPEDGVASGERWRVTRESPDVSVGALSFLGRVLINAQIAGVAKKLVPIEPVSSWCPCSRALNTNWEEKLSIQFGRQGGVTHQFWRRAPNAVCLNGVGHDGDDSPNAASSDASTYNFLTLMLAGRWSVLASGDGAGRAIVVGRPLWRR